MTPSKSMAELAQGTREGATHAPLAFPDDNREHVEDRGSTHTHTRLPRHEQRQHTRGTHRHEETQAPLHGGGSAACPRGDAAHTQAAHRLARLGSVRLGSARTGALCASPATVLSWATPPGPRPVRVGRARGAAQGCAPGRYDGGAAAWRGAKLGPAPPGRPPKQPCHSVLRGPRHLL